MRYRPGHECAGAILQPVRVPIGNQRSPAIVCESRHGQLVTFQNVGVTSLAVNAATIVSQFRIMGLRVDTNAC